MGGLLYTKKHTGTQKEKGYGEREILMKEGKEIERTYANDISVLVCCCLAQVPNKGSNVSFYVKTTISYHVILIT